MATELIWVQGNLKGRHKLRPGQVALHEVNPLHPLDEMAGENRTLIKAGEQYPPKQVALTAAVADKITKGELKQLSAADAKKLGGVPAKVTKAPAKANAKATPEPDDDEDDEDSEDESDDEE
jgi:hypothetical protein